MSKARRALAWSFMGQYLNTLLQFVTTIIISRLLTPEEIGIFSLAASFVLLGQLLRDFGSGQYIIQEQELTDDRIRAAFTVTLTSGWLVATIVFLLAPYAATFFEQPAVEHVMQLLAINFALIPFGSITMAYLQRKLQFRQNMLVRVSSSFIGSVTSISCAVAGMSYIGLAWGAVAGSVATIILAAVVRPGELPKLPGLREVPRVLSFASRMSTSTIIGQLNPVLIDMIVGKLLGAAPLGLLSRQRGVIALFETLVMRGLHPVVTPLFAEKHRDGHQLATSYLHGISCVTGLAWPFYSGLTLLSPHFVLVLFGPNWVPAAALIQIACVGVMVRAPVMLAQNVLIGTGNVSALLTRQVVMFPLGIGVTFFAAQISLEAVVAAAIPMSLLWVGLVLPKLLQITSVTLPRFALALMPSLLVSVASSSGAGLALLALQHVGVSSSVVLLLIPGMVGGLCYLLAVIRLEHPLASELQSFRDRIGRRKTSMRP